MRSIQKLVQAGAALLSLAAGALAHYSTRAAKLRDRMWLASVRNYAVRYGMVLNANTITNLIPTLYAALDVVSRELVGLIPAVSRDSGAERAALNQVVNIFVAPAAATGDIAPGATPPNDGDQVLGNQTMTITKSKYSPVRWNGEEQLSVSASGQRSAVVVDQFTQSLRALVNLIEIDLAGEYKNLSRSFGTAGAAPFGTAADLSDTAQLLKILDDNGAPRTGRQLALGTAAMANMRGKQSVLFKVNEAGTDELLRQGIVGRLQGFDLRDSAAILTPAKGTGAGYTSTAAGFAIGTTVIPLITGAGTVLAGDTVTFAGDTNKYIVSVGVAAPGSITLNLPGLRQAIPAVATALTVGNAAAQNMAFSRNCIQLATRAPALPEGGDMADDRTIITDPVSGLSFEVSLYRQYRQVKWEVAIAWGWKTVKSEHGAVLLG